MLLYSFLASSEYTHLTVGRVGQQLTTNSLVLLRVVSQYAPGVLWDVS